MKTEFADVSETRKNEWGQCINFDGPECGPVREYFVGNAAYWVDEFHLDGLSLDATQQIFDDSNEHVLLAISRKVRERAGKRSAYLVAENETLELVAKLASMMKEPRRIGAAAVENRIG